MRDFRLTSRAESDLAEIADYTIETFGIKQAWRYRDALESCFQKIADNPKWDEAQINSRRSLGATNISPTPSST